MIQIYIKVYLLLRSRLVCTCFYALICIEGMNRKEMSMAGLGFLDM